MSFDKLVSFGMTVCWSVMSLIGYFLLHWDLGETIIFVNLGFASFFLNYFLLFSFLSFREYFVVRLKEGEQGAGYYIYRFFVAIIQHVSNQFLLLCAFVLLCGISITFVALYFHMAQKINILLVEDLQIRPSFLWMTLAGGIFAGIEFRRFYRIFEANRTNPRKVFDWDALKVFQANHRRKLHMYYFGSVVAIIVDVVVSGKIERAGIVSLVWLFFLNAYWAYVDLRFPIGTIEPEREI